MTNESKPPSPRDFRMGGCPSCGSASCVALSCSRPSAYGSLELQAAVLAQCVEKDKPQQGEYAPLPDNQIDNLVHYAWPDLQRDTVRTAFHDFADATHALRAARGAAQAVPADACHSAISGALFDFLGYLTTLEESVRFGSFENASPAVEHLRIWAEKRNLSLDEAQVNTWHIPAAPAQDAEDAARLDWLSTFGSGGVRVENSPHDNSTFSYWSQEGEIKTPREAIDAARAQTAQPEEGQSNAG